MIEKYAPKRVYTHVKTYGNCNNYSILNENEERIANEAVDVLYVAIGTVLRLDSRISKVALKEVIDKNNNKTLITHYINEAGKVSRRS